MSFTLIHTLSDEQIEELWRLYRDEWWTAERGIEDVRRMLDNTDVVVGLEEPDRRLAAFARALTDGVYKALVLDVIVADRWRSQGLGRRLMDALLAHPELADVHHFELYCLDDMAPFYEQWGFQRDLGSLRFLRRAGRA